jgi:hypothetical protein
VTGGLFRQETLPVDSITAFSIIMPLTRTLNESLTREEENRSGRHPSQTAFLERIRLPHPDDVIHHDA